MHMSTLTSSTMSVLPPPPQAMTQTVNASSSFYILGEPTAAASGTNVAAGATRSNRGREKVSFTNFQQDDLDLVIFDMGHQHHMLFSLTNSTKYFIHTESLQELALTKADQHCRMLARLKEKEYCVAKKSSNRFNVPVGCKFYRVRVSPALPTKRSSASSP